MLFNNKINISTTLSAIKLPIAMLTGLLLAFAISSIIPSLQTFNDVASDLKNEVLRLHILANSDDAVDQKLKLAVRDRILIYEAELFGSAKSLDDAIKNTNLSIDEIERIAADEIEKSGQSYPVNAFVTNMYFTTRHYENFTLPAGNYNALRVEIGEAKGKNWWCVLYPPLCLPAASSEALSSFSEEELEIMTNFDKYEVRFAVVELYEKLKDILKSSVTID